LPPILGRELLNLKIEGVVALASLSMGPPTARQLQANLIGLIQEPLRNPSRVYGLIKVRNAAGFARANVSMLVLRPVYANGGVEASGIKAALQTVSNAVCGQDEVKGFAKRSFTSERVVEREVMVDTRPAIGDLSKDSILGETRTLVGVILMGELSPTRRTDPSHGVSYSWHRVNLQCREAVADGRGSC